MTTQESPIQIAGREFAARLPAAFSAEQCRAALAGFPQAKLLMPHLSDLLLALPGQQWTWRSIVFQGAKCLIKPTQMELSKGVLVPGHRFLPFYPLTLVSPDDINLVDVTGKLLSMTTAAFDWSDVEYFHRLFPQDARRDYLAACTPEYPVFDCRAWYEGAGFAEGDWIEAELLDWWTARFGIRRRAAPGTSEQALWRSAWLEVAVNACTTQPPYELDQQLACFWQLVPEYHRRNPANTFGSLLSADTRQGARLSLVDSGSQNCFWLPGQPCPPIHTPPSPLGDAEGAAQTSVMDQMLGAHGTPMDGVALQLLAAEAKRRNRSFRQFLAELRGLSLIPLSGPSALPFLEELWEATSEQPDNDPRLIGDLRAEALQLYRATVRLCVQVARALGNEPDDSEFKPNDDLIQLSYALLSMVDALETGPLSIRDRGQIVMDIKQYRKLIGSLTRAFKQGLALDMAETAEPQESSEPSKTRPSRRVRRQRPAAQARYTLEITLPALCRPLRRLVEVPGNRSLGELHQIIQAAMGWTDSHLHEFRKGKQVWTDPQTQDHDWDFFGKQTVELDENAYRLDDLGLRVRSSLHYNYDFGDDWQHEIRVVRVAKPGPDSPPLDDQVCCLEGRWSCPPEDCGGEPGYDMLLMAIGQAPVTPDADPEWLGDLREWWTGKFKPDAFDLAATNRRLAKL